VIGEPAAGGGAVVSIPADQLANVGPVLLLDVGVVVLLVGTAAGELDLLGAAVADQVVVEELAAVVGVDAAEAEGQALAHVLEGGDDPSLALAGHPSGFGP